MPTVLIINDISAKLGLNIYESFYEIFIHNNTQTHELIEEINECLISQNIEMLRKLVDKANDDVNFLNGEPFQFLRYSQSCISSFSDKDYPEAIRFALSGLQASDTISIKKKEWYSNIELMLLFCLAVNYMRCKDFESCEIVYNLLIEYISKVLDNKSYSIHIKYHFELNFSGRLLYSYYLYDRKTCAEKYADLFDKVISTLTKCGCMDNLPELIVCSACLTNDQDKKNELMLKSRQLGYFIYGEEKMEQKIARISEEA